MDEETQQLLREIRDEVRALRAQAPPERIAALPLLALVEKWRGFARGSCQAAKNDPQNKMAETKCHVYHQVADELEKWVKEGTLSLGP
jgi:hypothetical protein